MTSTNVADVLEQVEIHHGRTWKCRARWVLSLVACATFVLLSTGAARDLPRPARFANLANDLQPADLAKEPDDEIYGWWGAHYAPRVAERLDPRIDNEQFPGSLVPYLRSRMTPVFQANAPKKQEVVERLELHVAAGSYGTAIVQLYALVPCRGVRVDILPMGRRSANEPLALARWVIYSLSSQRPGYLVRPPAERPAAASANADAVRAHAKQLEVSVSSLQSKRAAGELSRAEADHLERAQAALSRAAWRVANVSGDIAQGSTQEVWAMFYVPNEAPLGGRFQRLFRITPEGSPPTEIPITIHVEPFRLVEPQLACGFWYSGLQAPAADLPPQRPQETPRVRHSFEEDALDLKAMGMNALGYAKIPVPYAHVDGLDLKPFEKAMSRLQKAGFALKGQPHSCWYNYAWACYDSGYLMSPKITTDRIVETMQALDRLCDRHPEWPNIIVCLTDELGWKEKGRLRQQNERFFREHPGAWPPDGARLTEAAETARRVRDLGLHHVKLAFISNRKRATELLLPVCKAGYMNFGGLTEGFLRRGQKLACELYTYNTWRSRMAFGYYNWKCSRAGSHGNLQWGYGRWGEPFVLHYPQGRKIRHRIYQQMAEGVEDLRYLNTLEALIAVAPNTVAARRARALLDEIDSRLTVEWSYGAAGHKHPNFWGGPMADAYDTYRRKIAEAIAAFPQSARRE